MRIAHDWCGPVASRVGAQPSQHPQTPSHPHIHTLQGCWKFLQRPVLGNPRLMLAKLRSRAIKRPVAIISCFNMGSGHPWHHPSRTYTGGSAGAQPPT